MRLGKNESDLKQILTEIRKTKREDNKMEVAPLRSFDDFLLTKSRFQVSWTSMCVKSWGKNCDFLTSRFRILMMKNAGSIGLSTT